jgi:hypothetical protein
MNRRVVTLVSLVVITLGSIFGFYKYQTSFQKVILENNDGATISIYDSLDVHGDIESESATPIKTSGEEEINFRLKKGSYTYIAKAPDDTFESNVGSFELGDKVQNVKVQLPYSKSKLGNIANQLRPSVENLLKGKYDFIMPKYVVGDIQAFGRGEWLGVRLNPLDPKQDTYLGIIKVENNNLTMATDPPAIIISKPVYPDIPQAIITYTNLMVKDLN